MKKEYALKKGYCKKCNFYQERCIDGDMPTMTYRPGTRVEDCPLTEDEAKTLGSGKIDGYHFENFKKR